MGAWGAGSFENDAASEWAADLADGGDVAMVHDTLAAAAACAPDEYLESDEGAEALAAAEVVAAAAGRPAKGVPMGNSGPHAIAWAMQHPKVASDSMVELALEALDRVGAPESELAELWAADGSPGAAGPREWFSELEDLRNRLSG